MTHSFYSAVRRTGFALLCVLGSGSLFACSLNELVGDSDVPPGTADPGVVASEAGAIGLHDGAIQLLAEAVAEYSMRSGLLGDELRPADRVRSNVLLTDEIALDSRYLPGEGETVILSAYQSAGNSVFVKLQKTRGAAQQARGALRAYAPLVWEELSAHLHAIEGYADLLLADLYCSGIPLSTVTFNGDYTLAPGSPTTEVYQQAITHFDSAIALAGDSTRARDLARIGKGRALLALGRYAEAGAAVTGIPTSYRYELVYSAVFPNAFRKVNASPITQYSVSDGEGVDGAPGIKYDSLKDPRVVLNYRYGPNVNVPYRTYLPQKFDTTGLAPIVLASGIEAGLIRAEAELYAGGPWLATLNTLRSNGGVAGLAPESDPGTRDTRINLLFRERALWLFLTGHRQGDMRRLIRNYGRAPSTVYAMGAYYRGVGAGVYGSYVTLPIPLAEQQSNPSFRGCINRDA